MSPSRQLPRTWWGLLLALVGVAVSVYLASGTGGPGADSAGSGAEARTSASAAPSSAVPSTAVPSTAAPSSNAPSPTYPSTDPVSGLAWVELADLPPEATDTVELIEAGGPYPYDQDDGTFGNFEGILPDHPRGYYREYTVETPGSSHRGARRIVSGADGELYWTADHYQSFDRIVGGWR